MRLKSINFYYNWLIHKHALSQKNKNNKRNCKKHISKTISPSDSRWIKKNAISSLNRWWIFKYTKIANNVTSYSQKYYFDLNFVIEKTLKEKKSLSIELFRFENYILNYRVEQSIFICTTNCLLDCHSMAESYYSTTQCANFHQ